MQMLRSFVKRITDDFKQKKLIPLKILFFVHASTLFVLYPYLTIHMRELGINVEETAIMSAVTPVVSIVMPPLAGMVADKIGNFRLLLALSSVLGGASALLLLMVPVGRLTVTFPPEVELLTVCMSDSLHLKHMQEYPCKPLHPYPYDINVTLASCGFLCELSEDLSEEDLDTLIHTSSYEIQIKHFIYRHTMTSYKRSPKVSRKDHSASRIMKNEPFFDTSISKMGDREFFFPAPQLYHMECPRYSKNITCLFDLQDLQSKKVEATFNFRISHDHKKKMMKIVSYDEGVLRSEDDEDVMKNISCKDNFTGPGELGVRVKAGERGLSKCAAACATLTPRKALCSNLHQQIEIDPVFTFWTYLAVRVFIGIIGGTAFAMFEGAVIAIIREQRADYGLQRVYGSIGGMISSPLSGLLIDYASRGKGYTDFRPAFYLYAVLKIASGALMLTIDLEFKQPAQNLLEDVITVFRNVELVALFIACFVMGTAWGYIESFLFWLLQDLGASRSLMGITITVGGVAGLPLLVLSGPIIRKLGHANVLFIGFIFYAIRLIGYSLIYEPWLCLIFEALESVTSSLSFTAAVTYAARLSSQSTDTSVQGLLGGLYYGVGKGSGSLIGGYLMKFFGTRPTYQIFAAAVLLTGCIYFAFNLFYISKRAAGDENDLYKKKSSHTDVEGSEKKVCDKINGTIDVATKLNTEKIQTLSLNKPLEFIQSKLVTDNTDGGSDSGVDNPVFNETEGSQNDAKKICDAKCIT